MGGPRGFFGLFLFESWDRLKHACSVEGKRQQRVRVEHMRGMRLRARFLRGGGQVLLSEVASGL